jgi:hypothetical protein
VDQNPEHAKPVPDFAKGLLGCWQDDGDKDSVVCFEARKCIFARLGKPDTLRMRAIYEPGKVVTYSWGRKAEYLFRPTDQGLILTGPDRKTKLYKKLEKTPAEVEVRPLPLGEAQNLSKERVQSIRRELADRTTRDQEVRTNPAKRVDMEKVDSDNTSFLIKLVKEVGWIDVERFGAKASNDAFLLVQHSGHLPLMLAALPLIEKDVKAKRLDAQPYALLFDRLHIMLGEKQRYGTQIGTNEKGELVVPALEDPKRVEELRKSIGLFPLTKYLEFFEKENGGRPVRIQDDE